MECLGGNGYVEESMLARLYREAPVNAIWEGSGNVMCLDVLRALSREAEVAQAVLVSLREQCGGVPGIEDAIRDIGRTLRAPDAERDARTAVERLASVAAVAALRRMRRRTVAQRSRAIGWKGRGAGLSARPRLTAPTIALLLDRALPT